MVAPWWSNYPARLEVTSIAPFMQKYGTPLTREVNQ